MPNFKLETPTTEFRDPFRLRAILAGMRTRDFKITILHRST